MVRGPPLHAGWLALGALGACAALMAAAAIDEALPAPLGRDAPGDRFIADIAHEHLVNLTSIGPRVFPRALSVRATPITHGSDPPARSARGAQ